MRNRVIRSVTVLIPVSGLALSLSGCGSAEPAAAASTAAVAEHRVDVPALTVGTTDLESTLQISPNGTNVILQYQDHQDLFMVTLHQERRAQPLVQTRFAERNGEISPDGRWLAYDANDTHFDKELKRLVPTK